MLFVQNEATNTRRRFPIFLVDATDGITPETGETGGQPQISKAGGAWGNTTATLTAIGNGAYYVELTATELNTAGDIIVRYKSANTAEFNLHADVLAINVHDTVRAGLTALPNANAEAAGGLYTRGTGAGQINQDANGRVDTRTAAMAADVMTAAATAADFSTEVNAPVLAVLGALANAASSGDPNTSNTMVQMLKQIVNTLEGTAGIPTWPAAAAPANAVSLAEAVRQIYTTVGLQATSAQAVALQADTDDIQARLPAALVGGRIDASVGAMAANTVTATALDPTAGAEIADAVWDEALAGHLTAGSTGAALNGAGSAGDPWTTPLPGAYGAGTAGNLLGNLDDAVAAVQADTDNIQTRLPAALVSGRMDSSVGAMAANVMTGAAADPTLANEIADQVWDEPSNTHLTAGSTGSLLNGINNNFLLLPSSGEIADAVWDEPVAGHGTAGSTGEALIDATTGGGAATPADVLTQVNAALDAPVAQPGQGAPAAAVSLRTALAMLYKAWRNRTTQSATEYRLFADDAVTVDHKAVFSDNGTLADRHEVGTGP